jgi:transcriptional regulator with XRE-family HTH domain
MDAEQIGAAIAARRRLLKLTQRDVAELAGIDRRTLSEIESARGPRGATLTNLLSVSATLGMELAIEPMGSLTHGRAD